MSKATKAHEDTAAARPKRRWWRWLWRGTLVGLLGLVIFLVWLNGPGIRFLAPRIADHFGEKAGINVEFRMVGTLLGGIGIRDAKVTSDGVIEKLTLKRLDLDYAPLELIEMRIRSLKIDGLDADVALQPSTDEEKPPLDLEKLVRQIREARQWAVPVQIELTDIATRIRKEGDVLFRLESSDLIHASGSSDFHLRLGAIGAAGGTEIPAAESVLTWEPDRILLDQLDPYPSIGVRDLAVALPETGPPDLSVRVLVDDGELMVDTSGGVTAAAIDLRSGEIDLPRLAGRFGVEIPVQARLTSLDLQASKIFPDPLVATGRLQLTIEDIVYEDWEAEQLVAEVMLEDAEVSAALRVRALGSPVDLNAEAPLVRANSANWSLGEVKGDYSIENFGRVLDALALRFRPDSLVENGAPEVDADADGTIGPLIEPPAPPVGAPALATDAESPAAETPPKSLLGDVSAPDSSLVGSFSLNLDPSFKPLDTVGGLRIVPRDESVAPLALNARWTPATPLEADLALPGLQMNAVYDFENQAYQGDLALEGFSTVPLGAWLDFAAVPVADVVEVDGTWSGSGNLPAVTHQGSLNVSSVRYLRNALAPVEREVAAAESEEEIERAEDDALVKGTKPPEPADPAPEVEIVPPPAPIVANLSASYSWPETIEVRELVAEMGDQRISLHGGFNDNLIELKDLNWRKNGTNLVDGSASLPLPEELDFNELKTAVLEETRPLELDLKSQVIPVSFLADWIPQISQISSEATFELNAQVSGTYAEPVIALKLIGRDLAVAERADLPPADVSLQLLTADGQLKLNGDLITPHFPPVVMEAEMPFRPRVWADDAEQLKSEEIQAKLDFPRLELERFKDLIPDSISDLSGVVTGSVTASGTINEPILDGFVTLTNGNVRIADDPIPEITGINSRIEFALDRVRIENFRATIAGGTLDLNGEVPLDEAMKPGDLDFTLRGRQLPVMRNDTLIIRANADLRLTGPLESATLSGRVGVVDSLFFKDIEILPIGTAFTAPSAAKLPSIDPPTRTDTESAVPTPFSDWKLDLTVKTDDPFLIRGNLGSGQVTVDMRVGGTIGDPRPDGSADIEEAEASLPFSTLEVTGGNVRLSPKSGLDPILEIRARSEIRPYRIDMYAYGHLSDPQLVLTSNPPLPETEIMTLLATGTTTEGLEDTQAASARAIQLLAEEVRRGRVPFARQLRPVFKLLDQVDFSIAEADPYSSDFYSTATIELTDRFYLSAGLGEEGNTRVLGLWRFTFR